MMKWFDPPRSLLQVKKRAQLILLFFNIIIASVKLWKIDESKPYSICRQQYDGSVVCYCSR